MGDFSRSNIVLAFAIAVGLYLCYVLRDALILIYVSIIFAVIFSPLVEKICCIHIGKWSPGRGLAILTLIAIVLIALGVFFALALPPIVNDSQNLSRDLPARMGQLRNKVSQLPLGDKIASRVDVSSIEQYVGELLNSVFKVFKSVAGGLTALITLIVLTAYFILDGKRSFDWAMSLVPTRGRGRLRNTLLSAGERIQRWLGGQAMLMLILGSASAIVFGFLHVRYFYALAVFAGVANFVPILGPIATVILAGLVAAFDSWTKVLGVLIFFAVYQQVENSYLTPKIMKATVNLPAVAVITALLIGGELAGLLGAIVAVPTAALVATLVNEYGVKRETASLTKAS